MISTVASPATETAKDRLLAVIAEYPVRPTDLLEQLQADISYGSFQDALSELLDAGKVKLGPDLLLRLK
ncbi:MAG TPA: hypothetical protein VMT20_17045 [Terriglobia bacterium]|nr:hypothetical protein [Terriglobia bacterium]